MKQHFFVSGLEVNKHKLELYTSRMHRDEVQRLLNVSGFKQGRLPFRYLGVPTSHKRMEVKECMILVEKMTTRVRC